MTRLADRVPVELLDSNRVERVERRVLAAFEGVDFAPRPRSVWRRWARMAIPALAVAGCAFAVYLNVRSTMAPIAEPLAVPVTSRVTQVRTGAHGAADELTIGNATVFLSPRTEASIEERGGGATLIRLGRGAIRCQVEPRAGRPPFVVLAGAVKVSVVGTVFTVERDGLDRVRVTVERGTVRVEHAEREELLVAGQAWRGNAAELAASASPARAIKNQTPVAAQPAPRSERGDTGDRVALARRRSQAPEAARKAETSAAITRRARPPVARTGDPRRDLRRARSLAAPLALKIRDPHRAINEYRQLSNKSGATAEHAMYSIAYVQLRRLGDRAAALRAAGFYRRRFASGKHARDVAWLRMLALCDRGPSRSCRAAAHDYLARFGSNAAELELEVVQALIDWVR